MYTYISIHVSGWESRDSSGVLFSDLETLYLVFCVADAPAVFHWRKDGSVVAGSRGRIKVTWEALHV